MISNSQGVNWKGPVTAGGKNTVAPALRWMDPNLTR